MKAITLWQPWASLVAEGVKTIETRSWAAPAGLIGQTIGIHAAAKRPRDEWGVEPPSPWTDLYVMAKHYDEIEDVNNPGQFCYRWTGPLGAIVATSRLVACLPMVDRMPPQDEWVKPWDVLTLDPWPIRVYWPGYGSARTVQEFSGQLPYGDFAPGRWAWLLDDIAPVTERCPWCWGCHAGATSHDPETCDWCNPLCPVCGGTGRCDPVPAKGRQRVWRWEP